jgi:SAM-dependent methyltransferase
VTEEWISETEEIYRQYLIYAQSCGVEQPVFDLASGQAVSRSERLMEKLGATLRLPSQGRMLDVGCGNGAFLRAFYRRYPDWKLIGTETTEKYKKEVEALQGVEAVYVGSHPPAGFQFVSMVHVLEHIPNPVKFLREVWDLLEDNGLLLVQIPDFRTNPFDLMIADHCSHFSLRGISGLVREAGLQIVAAGTWIEKEITVVARKVTDKPENWASDSETTRRSLQIRVDWLRALVRQTEGLEVDFGVFGSSIGASWLFAQCENRVRFFIDEDISRIGKVHLGRPVLAPATAPKGIPIVLPMAPEIAKVVLLRFSNTELQIVTPPSLGDSGSSQFAE